LSYKYFEYRFALFRFGDDVFTPFQGYQRETWRHWRHICYS